MAYTYTGAVFFTDTPGIIPGLQVTPQSPLPQVQQRGAWPIYAVPTSYEAAFKTAMAKLSPFDSTGTPYYNASILIAQGTVRPARFVSPFNPAVQAANVPGFFDQNIQKLLVWMDTNWVDVFSGQPV